ncbi:MAG: hypothetical protein GY719_23775 [bacterium]|nr:hypothetical protein [bacterium]
MKKIEDIDTLITEALSREEAEFYDQLGEQSVHDLVTELFGGRYRWLNLASIPVMIAFCAALIYCGWRFYHAPEVREMLLWGVGIFYTGAAIMAMKLWAWMEIQRNSLTREIKRVELQLAHLAGKLGG